MDLLKLLRKNRFQTHSRYLKLKLYFLDDLQVIDWEIDSDREDTCDEFEDRESVVEISDRASCTSSRSLTPPETLPELPKVRTNCFQLSILFMAFVSHSLWCFVCNSFLRDYHF